ncbi:MAG TPA: 4-hydroxy-3-methylbut-2-enyl diphosphate reductase [Planctomycetota bacterium]|nr:4-hydroxy-3-methylbut-2-enyl diphosphate reductase [Planctomycetota bacterium]
MAEPIQVAKKHLAMEVLLAQPRGFCAGVDRAIEIVERALLKYGAPVFVLHEIVHNKHVLEDLRARGVKFVDSLEQIPEGSVTVFSAHGVAAEIVRKGNTRRLRVIDATCPLVTKVHDQAQRYEFSGREVILVGHPGHPEVEGTRGRIEGPVHVLSTVAEVEALSVKDPERLAYVTQTTLSVDDTREVIEALTRRFPSIKGPALKDICYATQNRQDAVREMTGGIDLLLVVGSQNSSNSNRLRELGERKGVPAHLIDDERDIDAAWFRPGLRIGVTAGASAPEAVVQKVVERLRALGVQSVTEMAGKREAIVFKLPDELTP